MWPRNADKIRKILLFLVPFVYVAVLCNSVTGELFWSDDPEEMAFVRSRSFSQLLVAHDAFGYFRPIKNLLWFGFSRLEPYGIEWCHILAIAIGIVSFFPVLLLCRRIFANEWKALAAATTWLLSPTLVSSAAWLSCVNIQMMVAFASAAIVLHDKGWEGGTFHPARFGCADVFLFLALVSYECAIAVVLILLAFDWILRPGRLRNRVAWKAHACHWIVAAVYLMLRAHVGANVKMQHRWIEATRGQLILSSPFFTARHFTDWFWPFGKFSVGGSYIWGEVSPMALAGCAAIGIAVLVFAILSRKRFPALSFCLLFALLAFAPVSNCLGHGNGPYGDYYLALASVGLSVGSIEIVWRIATIRGPLFLPAFAIAASFVLARVAAVPEAARWARFWSNDRLAYAESLHNHPESLQNQLGELRNLVVEQKWDEVLELGKQIERKVGPDSSFMRFVYVSRLLNAVINEKNKEAGKAALEGFSAVADEYENAGEVSYYRGVIAEFLDHDPSLAEAEYRKALEDSRDTELSNNCRKALDRIASSH